MSSIVTLMTDFGYSDGYVAQMKGVLLTLNPDCRIVDITHAVPPQDVRHGAYVLKTVMDRFPAGTIHVVVVDPGVGTTRLSIAVRTGQSILIGPDNGVLTSGLVGRTDAAAFEISNPAVMGDSVSRTFHGRDIFAPSAGHASLGVDIERFGDRVDDPVVLAGWTPETTEDGVRGQVLHVDRFGNLITNIGAARIAEKAVTRIAAGRCVLDGLSITYGDVETGGAVALIGSQETLEISVNGGNAAEAFGVARGDAVEVRWNGSR